MRHTEYRHTPVPWLIIALLLCILGVHQEGLAQSAVEAVRFSGSYGLNARAESATVVTLGHRLSLGIHGRLSPYVSGEIRWQNDQQWGSSVVGMGLNTPFFHTAEAYLDITPGNATGARTIDWGTWRLGRQHFHLGPIGLLVANPFDAIEGIRWRKEWSGWTSDVFGGRLDTSYVTHLNYVYDTDGYLAMRTERPYSKGLVGATWLVQGLGTERGLSLDAFGHRGGNRYWVFEIAAFEQSRTSITYDGWSLAAIGSLDVYVDERTAVTLNAGIVDDGFVPMATNLRYAGGSLGFSNDSKGIEIYVSHLLRSSLVVEAEIGLRSRWSQPDSNVKIGLTAAHPAPLTSTVSLEGRSHGSGVNWTGRVTSEIRF